MEDGSVVAIYIGIWIVLGGFVGYAIGQTKGRPWTGLFFGLLLGFIGWIIVALMDPTPEERQRRRFEAADDLVAVQEVLGDDTDLRPCPWCAESIKAAARVCRFCGRDVPQAHPIVVILQGAGSDFSRTVRAVVGATNCDVATAQESVRTATESEPLQLELGFDTEVAEELLDQLRSADAPFKVEGRL